MSKWILTNFGFMLNLNKLALITKYDDKDNFEYCIQYHSSERAIAYESYNDVAERDLRYEEIKKLLLSD